jgi:hypothetical protein
MRSGARTAAARREAAAPLGDRPQQPAAVAERDAEFRQIPIGQFPEDVQIDVVRREWLGIALKVVQP